LINVGPTILLKMSNLATRVEAKPKENPFDDINYQKEKMDEWRKRTERKLKPVPIQNDHFRFVCDGVVDSLGHPNRIGVDPWDHKQLSRLDRTSRRTGQDPHDRVYRISHHTMHVDEENRGKTGCTYDDILFSSWNNKLHLNAMKNWENGGKELAESKIANTYTHLHLLCVGD